MNTTNTESIFLFSRTTILLHTVWCSRLVQSILIFLLGCNAHRLEAQTTSNLPPTIPYDYNPRSQVVVSNATASFTVQRSGTSPLQYQWLFNGAELSGATNQTFRITRCQPQDEGNYNAIVRNDWGAVTSQVARLTVTPLATHLLARVFTNRNNTPLPYRLFIPTRPTTETKLPLVLFLHGAGELGTDNISQLQVQPYCMAYISYSNQVTYPTFFAAPQAHPSWSASVVLSILSDFLDALISEYSIDTNRISVTGLSLGGYGSWSMLALRPDYFAAGIPICGWGDPSPESCRRFAHVPIWSFHAADDSTVSVSGSRDMINTLRQVGGHPIYTEYRSGGHGIWANAYATPGLVEWTSAQRRGEPSPVAPQLIIQSPTTNGFLTTSLTNLDLGGTAWCGQEPISQVTWTNLLLRSGNLAQGTNTWTATGVSLKHDDTNSVVILASTVTWAPGLKGGTTFGDTLIVQFPPPIRMIIERQQAQIVLNWTGGQPPFDLQSTDGLLQGPWIDIRKDASPPVALPLSGTAAFYRILAR